MSSVQCRVERNSLTTPYSYSLRFMPHNIYGYEELTDEIVRDNPSLNKEQVLVILQARDQTIKKLLINGNQVTLEDAFSYRLSFNARLNEPDDQLPSPEQCLRVKISASRPLVKEVRQKARLERLPSEEKLPHITSTEDTALELNDVLYNNGVLRLAGNDLFFDRQDLACGCLLQGTRSGSAVQTRFASIANTEVLIVPDIPAQEEPWNNEYTISLSTRFTEHGTLRTSTYQRRLRTPLEVSGFDQPNMEVGILSGKGATPLVVATGGTRNGEGMIRVQAVIDARDGHLLFSLLDMHENGAAGDPIPVRDNGDYTLSGFDSSLLSSLTLRVDDYEALHEMIRNDYAGQLVDVLEVQA